MKRPRPNTDSRSLTTALVNLAAWKIGTAFVLLGILCLWGSSALEGPHGLSSVETTLREVGALLFVTGALGVFWDLLGRRALTRELLDAADVSGNIAAAGLKRIVPRYLEVDWEAHLESARHVDLFFAYARTWRTVHATALRKFVEQDGVRLRVILPDRDNDQLMALLSAKFRYSSSDLVRHIEDAESDFMNLGRQAGSQATVEVRRTSEFPVFSYYRLDRQSFAVLYGQAPGRTDVPTFECAQGGSLSTFFRDQFEALWVESVRAPEHD